jgi:DNA polymerase (family X)
MSENKTGITKETVAEVLKDIGELLELKGENPFKTRAYFNAAKLIANLDLDLATLVREDQLGTLPGIGPALKEKITTLVTTGKLPYHEELVQSLPKAVRELSRLQGVGPTKVHALIDKLGVNSIEELKIACEQDHVAKLKGFGAKTQENILKSISYLSQHVELHRYDEALPVADALVASLKALPQTKQITVCGSLRRRKEIVRDIDILATAKDAAPLMDAFTSHAHVERILGKGETKSSVLLKHGFQADLRVVADKEFPFAQHYFTGSKEHNIRMRQRAIELGYKLNEYGLFKGDDSRSVTAKTEEDIFKKLGMSYVPPELREDRGEIEAALQKKLPDLIELSDLRGAFHVHSTWSDGKASLEDMIAEAQRLGWEYVGISDHSQTAVYAQGLNEERVKQQRAEIEILRKKFKISIFWGTECDILSDGRLDYDDEVLSDYDFVIASVHSAFNLDKEAMTRRMVRALKNPYVTFLGHMSGRRLLKRDAYDFDVKEVTRAAVGEGVVIEVNGSPQRLDMDWRYHQDAKAAGATFSINPDAHSIHGLQDIRFGIGIARKGWLTKADVVNTLPLAAITKLLRSRK